MARIAIDESAPIKVPAWLHAVPADDVAPKRKAIDHTTNGRAIDVPMAPQGRRMTLECLALLLTVLLVLPAAWPLLTQC